MTSQALLSIAFTLLTAPAQPSQNAAIAPTFVVPSTIHEKEPFTFGMTGYVEGEVVAIKTVEGEVVARPKPDQLGRVFLPAGLAAGVYMFSSSGGSNRPRPPMSCTIGPGAGATGGGILAIANPPSDFNLRDGISLKGAGFDPNAANMVVELGNQPMQVLAATPNEVSTGPLGPNVPCGQDDLNVRNQTSGQGASLPGVMCYDLTSKLVRRTLTIGEQTTLEFKLLPTDAVAKVRARIQSGPVTFVGGSQETLVDIVNGAGKAPILSQPGNPGKFQIGWNTEGKVVYASGEGNEDPARAKRRQELYDKLAKAAEEAKKAAEKAEDAAKAAEDKGDSEKAAAERKKAAEKHKEAAANHRANRDYEKSAEEERKAAENARKSAAESDKAGKSQKPGKDGRRDAAQSEERAAADEQRRANTEARYDKQEAAEGQDRAADGYERAAKDYRANGEGSKASDAENAAKGARAEAERLRK